MQPTDPPRPTGKPMEDLCLTGMLIPWGADDQPCYVAMNSGDPAKPLIAIPLFYSAAQLHASVDSFRLECAHIKQIEDGQAFLTDVPRDIAVVVNPRASDHGTTVYTLVLRD